MLVLSRKIGESVIIGGKIVVTVVRVDGETVRVGIAAPADVPVHRREVYDEIQGNNRQALIQQRPSLPKLPPRIKADTSSPRTPAPIGPERGRSAVTTEPN
jgi:carbon storage regulator